MKQDTAAPESITPGNERDLTEVPAQKTTPESPAPETAAGAPPATKPSPPTPLPVGTGGIIKMRRQRMVLYTVVAALAGLLMAWVFASPFPNFLLAADPPVAADAVVLFGGHDFEARRKMADELVAKGLAKYVIVPAKGEILDATVSRAPVTPEKSARLAEAVKKQYGRAYVEATHLEVLQALDLLRHLRASSAILVSSPYHMRRIEIMTDRIFPLHRYELAFVPTDYEPRHIPWFLSWKDVKWVFSEWAKIVWFILYFPFT